MIRKGHINEGYEIKIFHEIGDAGVAIGMRSGIKNDPAPFVVWNYFYENGAHHFIGAHIRMKNCRLQQRS